MQAFRFGRPPFSFWSKVVAGVALVGLADLAFYGHRLGSMIGGFAQLLTVVLVVTRPSVLRERRAAAAVAAAAVFAAILADRPTLVGWTLFWTALTSAALLPRTGRPRDALHWAGRLLQHAILGLVGPVRDWRTLRRVRPGRKSPGWRALLSLAVLPLGGGAVFLWLFSAANPVIQQALGQIRWPDLSDFSPWRCLFWLFVGVAVWAVLRPVRRRRARARKAAGRGTLRPLDGAPLSTTSVSLALVVFNALFALQNGLDLAILWSGAGPPAGVTLAEYAHRGVYPLVATALLAAGFCLLFLREGSETAARPLIRRLVGLWVAQNVLLVASSILRTLDYVQVYSLTRFRIAALLWMVLVAIGLALIGWRMVKRKSAAWLINANALSVGVVLVLVSSVDLGEVAATWNVSHARDVGGRGAALDLCYLRSLHASALRPLLWLERRLTGAELRERVGVVRAGIVVDLRERQSDWRGWTWRGDRRLQAAKADGKGDGAFARWPDALHACDGGKTPRVGPTPPDPPPPTRAPLTGSPQP